MSTQAAREAMPALPGAQKIFSALLLRASFQTKACSLPPDPTTRIFINSSPTFLSKMIRLLFSLAPQPPLLSLPGIVRKMPKTFTNMQKYIILPLTECNRVSIIGTKNESLFIIIT
jgi:hypothetical protein